MQTMGRVGQIMAGAAALALLAMVNVGCSATQPQDTWTSAANQANQAASRADAAAGQAEAAAGRSEAAASRAEDAAGRSEAAAARAEAIFDRLMRK